MLQPNINQICCYQCCLQTSCVLVKIYPKAERLDFIQVIWEAEKPNGALMHFARFCFQLPGMWHLLPNVFFHVCKIIKSLPDRLGIGEELWAAISERTFVIYCHWLESTFPETGEKIIFAVRYIFFQIFQFQSSSNTLQQLLQYQAHLAL